MKRVVEFVKEAKGELMKVNWPSKKLTINYTMLVIGVSLAVALFLGGLDFVFSYLIRNFIIKQ